MEPRKSRYRLLLRVYAAENLRNVSTHGTYCKIYVGNADMAVSRKGRQSFKKFLQQSQANGNNNLSASASATASATTGGTTTRMREFKTKVQKFSRANPVWNEKFEVPLVDAQDDLVSLRVKSARLMSSPAVGACCVSLHDVPEDETVDRWVRLQDGKKDAGRVRIQMRLVRLDGTTQPQQLQQQQQTEPKTTENSGATIGSSRRTSPSSHPTHERSLAATDPTVYSTQSASSHPQTDTEHSTPSSSSSYSAGVAPYPNGSTTSFMSFSSEDDDADSYDGDTVHDSRRGGDQNASLLSSFRSLDRGTLLSEIGTPRTNGSFVGSLHQYNRNSIATSTPSRTTMVMSELDIAALSQQLTSDGPDGRHSGETEDTDSEEVEDDEFDVDRVSEGPRIPWNPTITRLLSRKSMNVLIDEEEDDDDIGLSTVSGSAPVERDSVPILDFPGPHDIDEIDCAFDDDDDNNSSHNGSSNNDSRRSNGSSLYMWDVSSDRASSDSLSW